MEAYLSALYPHSTDFLLEEDAENAIFTPQICIILVYSLGNPVVRGSDFLQMLHMQYTSRARNQELHASAPAGKKC